MFVFFRNMTTPAYKSQKTIIKYMIPIRIFLAESKSILKIILVRHNSQKPLPIEENVAFFHD